LQFLMLIAAAPTDGATGDIRSNRLSASLSPS